MPFVTQKVDAGVRKRCEGDDHDFEPLNKGLEDLFDPELLADITALQELYRNAMTGMSAAVERARNLLAQQGRTMDLRLFQEVFASQAVADLRRSLGSISDETARQVLAEVSVALMRLQRFPARLTTPFVPIARSPASCGHEEIPTAQTSVSFNSFT